LVGLREDACSGICPMKERFALHARGHATETTTADYDCDCRLRLPTATDPCDRRPWWPVGGEPEGPAMIRAGAEAGVEPGARQRKQHPEAPRLWRSFWGLSSF